MELNSKVILDVLDFAYDKAISGVPGLDTAYELANDYMKGNESLVDKANSLVRWQNSKAATSGFLTGLGGLLITPVTIPANLASVYYIQIRMIASIAIMGGYDPKDDRVKSLIYTCLAGKAVSDVLKDVGVQVGKKVMQAQINRISGEVIKKINQYVGFRLLTKAGSTGVINLTKMIPIVGGVVGGVFDLVTTNSVGDAAVNFFIVENKIEK